MTNTRRQVIEELEWSVECFEDSDDADPVSVTTLWNAISALKRNEQLDDDERKLIGEELNDIATKDVVAEDKKMRRAVNRLAHEQGLLERYDPTAISSSPEQTCQIDGIKYYAIATR